MGERSITVSTADGPMEVYEATPDRPAPRAVVVIQEAFGVNRHIQSVVRRLADAGYHAVAPALFHRAGGGYLDDYDNLDFNEVIALFEGVSDDTILGDVDAALGVLHDAGFADDHIGTVGFCFGGRATFLVAARRTLGAAVGFYGGGIAAKGALPYPALIDEAPGLRTPWLGLFGDQDASIRVEDVERLREALRAAPVPTEVVRYPDAGHGFHCDVRADYHQESARDAWSRALAWFDTYLA
ncbi:MAG TPA: dienelactone hydrolase family protein [Acidimicrobiia bacterium]|nr:dienelactone hydrolase family protein [Acidimicrobiia bacterium]